MQLLTIKPIQYNNVSMAFVHHFYVRKSSVLLSEFHFLPWFWSSLPRFRFHLRLPASMSFFFTFILIFLRTVRRTVKRRVAVSSILGDMDLKYFEFHSGTKCFTYLNLYHSGTKCFTYLYLNYFYTINTLFTEASPCISQVRELPIGTAWLTCIWLFLGWRILTSIQIWK